MGLLICLKSVFITKLCILLLKLVVLLLVILHCLCRIFNPAHLISIAIICHDCLFCIVCLVWLLCGHLSHGERFVVKESNDSFLTEHQLNDAFTLVLVQLHFRVPICIAKCAHACCHPRLNCIDSNAQARRGCVHLRLLLSPMLFAFTLYFVHGLLKQNFQLSLAVQLLVVLLPRNF